MSTMLTQSEKTEEKEPTYQPRHKFVPKKKRLLYYNLETIHVYLYRWMHGNQVKMNAEEFDYAYDRLSKGYTLGSCYFSFQDPKLKKIIYRRWQDIVEANPKDTSKTLLIATFMGESICEKCLDPIARGHNRCIGCSFHRRRR